MTSASDIFWDLILEGHAQRLRRKVKRLAARLQLLYDEIDRGMINEDGPEQKRIERQYSVLISELERWDPYAPVNFTAKMMLTTDEILLLEQGLAQFKKVSAYERLRHKLSAAKASLADHLYIDSVVDSRKD